MIHGTTYVIKTGEVLGSAGLFLGADQVAAAEKLNRKTFGRICETPDPTIGETHIRLQ